MVPICDDSHGVPPAGAAQLCSVTCREAIDQVFLWADGFGDGPCQRGAAGMYPDTNIAMENDGNWPIYR